MNPQGALLLKRRIYTNNVGKAFVCLGFQTYAAIGFPLETRRVGDKDGLCCVCDTNQNWQNVFLDQFMDKIICPSGCLQNGLGSTHSPLRYLVGRFSKFISVIQWDSLQWLLEELYDYDMGNSWFKDIQTVRPSYMIQNGVGHRLSL